MRSSSASTCRVLTRRCAGVFSRWCEKAAHLRIPSHSPLRAAVVGPVSVVLAAAADRPHLLPTVAARIEAGENSEDALRGAIAKDVAKHVPQRRSLSNAFAYVDRSAGRAGDASQMKSVTLELNGAKITYDVEPRETLADFLRERCRLTATHLGCEHGACGACTVAVDGQATRSCLRLAIMCNGHSVQTLEGMEDDTTMEVLRRHFHRMPCSPMRILHTGNVDDGSGHSAADSQSGCRYSQTTTERSHLSLHRLRGNRDGHRGGRARAWPRRPSLGVNAPYYHCRQEYASALTRSG